jgi:uncharacterized protein
MLCQIYRSSKKAETYLYLRYEDRFENLPEELIKTFGQAEPVMALELEANRKLARAEATEVLNAIEEKGYYLQLPPTTAELMPGQKELDSQMAKIDELNKKLPR